ncbi:MAG: OprO/OprP family phosphate-selective porin [Bacteroidales bacterium]|nr:OprO/OprP family phosphate-selective porin [Bacteroidales bacterium]
MKRFIAMFVGCLAISATAFAAETETTEAVAEPVAEAAPQSNFKEFLDKMPVKISGYLQTGWNYTHNKNASSSSFQAKRLRLIADGKVSDNIDFRLQIEAFNGIGGSTNGNGQKNIQVMDAFATWKINPAFKIRFGQFYTPLGYENYDVSPATLETVDFSNIVYRMACRNPYEYNFIDYGRDLGVMFMGDLGDSGQGFKYFHYDVALTNGSIPCKDDRNKSKDIYASVNVRPIKNLSVKASVNWGEYSTQALAGGTGVGTGKYNSMTRFIGGAWYNDPNGLDVRGEYGLLRGGDYAKEDGAYVLVGYHAGKFLPVVRWDMYNDKVNTTSTNNYNRILVGCTYQLCKNVKFQINYGHFMYDDEVAIDKSEQVQIMGLFKF